MPVPPFDQLIESGEAWTDVVLADLRAMDAASRQAWMDLLAHCSRAKSSKPSRKWVEQAQLLHAQIGDSAFEERLERWFPLVDQPRTGPQIEDGWCVQPAGSLMILDHHATMLRGLCWLAGMRQSPAMARSLTALALSCYRKVPGVGPRAVKVGNAALFALGEMPGRASLGHLAMLRVKVKFAMAQKVLEKALDTTAARQGLPRDEIEEMAVPGYGLTEVGVMRTTLGEYTAMLRVARGEGASATRLTWVNPQGKAIKSVPAAVKRDFGDDLKEIKSAARDIAAMLPAQRNRIDNLFIEPKSWAMSTWRERYLDHPLIGTIARRLIWLFNDGCNKVAAAWLSDDPQVAPYGSGRLVRVDGSPFEPEESATTVSLWRPIEPDAPPGSTATRSDVTSWRLFYEARRIRQPFKQAHREIYLLTDAERQTRLYSNRFAANFLKQHQFHALCGQRGWTNRLRLFVDDEYPPAYRLLPAWGLRAEFWIEGVDDTRVDDFIFDSGAYRYLSTDQVRFYPIGAAMNSAHASGGPYRTDASGAPEHQPVPLDQIPPLVLSEVMRDVDLFVGVASVGNNPEWEDGGPIGAFRDYWRERSFGELGESANTRRELLERLIPRLSIAPACTMTDRFLVVLGRRRVYKIHLGSGSILMEPNDQYLCIVPDGFGETVRGGRGVFLPFEGDRTLSIILSKAFLLAEDDTITDPTILRQIEGR